LSNILFGDNQYSMTGYVTGSNGNELAKYTSSLTPNVIFAGELSREQQEEELATWILSFDLRETLTSTDPATSDELNDLDGGGSPINIPFPLSPALISTIQPQQPGPGDGAAIVPEPGTGVLLMATLLLFAVAKHIYVYLLRRSQRT
jgi:hypothetical protein